MEIDTKRLEWLIFSSAYICHSRDGESCWVMFTEDEDIMITENFDDPRQAIDAARNGKVRVRK